MIGVDTFEGRFADFLAGDFNYKTEAIAEATKRAGTIKPTYVYGENGENFFCANIP